MKIAPVLSQFWSHFTTRPGYSIGYGDHLKRATYLISPKMTDEYAMSSYGRVGTIPEGRGCNRKDTV